MASSSLSSTVGAPENDDIGSLFEGMVLFSPPQTVSHTDKTPEQDQSSATSEPHTSVPLDENLFSDLTVVAPAETPDFAEERPLSPSSAAVTQRQISIRKKKRASGLRIGYGRDRDDPAPVVPNSNAYSEELKEPFPMTTIRQNEEQGQNDCHPSSLITAAKDYDPCRANHQIDPDLGQEDADADAASSPCSLGYLQKFENEEEYEEEEEDKLVVNSRNKNSSTIEFRYEEIQTLIANKLKLAREAVASVSVARKDSIKRRRKAAENLSQASAKYRELEKELEEACETEDFEKAERVSESLSSAEKEREHLIAVLREAEADCDIIDSKMKEALECQIRAEEECGFLLKSFALDASNNADLVLENAKEMSSKDMEEWLQSTERVELQKMELEVESYLLHEARLTLNNSIEHSVEDDQKERDLLYKTREFLKEDLEKLLALVKKKEAEISETNFNIERVEKRIAGVVFGFQEAYSCLDTKYNNLQSALSHVQSEYEILSKREKETENLLCHAETQVAKIREISRISAGEANMFQEVVVLRKRLLEFILQFMENKLRLTNTEEKLSADVLMLRRGISSARASLQELSSSKLSIQQEVDSLKQRLFFIDKRVPDLEAEKKVAATARNFKEAARISTEAKSLCVEKEGLEIKIENAKSKLKELEEQICNTIDRLQGTESQVLLKEKDLAMATLERLSLVANAATAERSAALELGDLEEADVLRTEAETLAAEARKLQPLYNLGDEDFTNLPKHFVPMDLVAKLGSQQLAELLASIHI